LPAIFGDFFPVYHFPVYDPTKSISPMAFYYQFGIFISGRVGKAGCRKIKQNSGAFSSKLNLAAAAARRQLAITRASRCWITGFENPRAKRL
jgi:hypothetical protein